VIFITFSPDGKWIASGGRNRAVKIFNSITGECVLTLEKFRHIPFSLSFSGDGRYLACNSFEVPQGYRPIEEHSLQEGRFTVFDFGRPNLGMMHPIEAILSAI